MSNLKHKVDYGSLLNQFLENDCLIEDNETKEMQRWLDEAENSIRSRSESEMMKN